MKQIDARGMACPQPVLMVKNAMDKSVKEATVLVDNQTALQNVTRFLKNEGFTKITSTEAGEDIKIDAKR